MVDFLEEELPTMDSAEMEELYRHFLVDDMPEEDDGDEDFEPPAAEEEEEGEEAGVRRRNIQARELSDLLQDAFKQLGPSAIPPGLRERVLDQLSMHFQLLIQTAVFAVQAAHSEEERKALGMLEHLAFESRGEGEHRRRTRARGNSSMWRDPLGDLPSVTVPGLLPGGTLKYDIKEAGDFQEAVEQLMTSRGGVVWPQLLPGKVRPRITRAQASQDGSPSQEKTRSTGGKGFPGRREQDLGRVVSSGQQGTFSMVEDRLLCRGVHLHGEEWDSIQANMLPHKSSKAIMHRYATLSGWAFSFHNSASQTSKSQRSASPWTLDEDQKLRNAVQAFGRKWTRIAHEAFPHRGREALRNRWAFLQERVQGGHDLTAIETQGMGGGPVSRSTSGEKSGSPTVTGVDTRAIEPGGSLEPVVNVHDTPGECLREMEHLVDSSPAMLESNTVRKASELPDRLAYAEDELSDDMDECPDGSDLASTHSETIDAREGHSGSQCAVQGNNQEQTDPGRTLPGKRLFEEDELSDE